MLRSKRLGIQGLGQVRHDDKDSGERWPLSSLTMACS